LHPGSEENLLSPETRRGKNAYLVGRRNAGCFQNEVQMRILVAAVMLSGLVVSLAVLPASAGTMVCTADNMAKSTAMMASGQTAANKEMAAANVDMSNGKMGSACRHYMKAQKLSMTK
jgi:hypothetical protein